MPDTGGGTARPVTPQSILTATLVRLGEALREVDGLSDEIIETLRGATELAAGLDPYLSSCTTPESDALRRLAERTSAHDWSAHAAGPDAPDLEQEMLSGHVEGQVLKFLVAATGARRVLEIGMFTGYSALAMAEALPEDGEVVACEIDRSVANFAATGFQDSPVGHKITVRVAPAKTSLEELAALGAPFDLIFIDADKEGYEGYYAAVLADGLLAPNGVICVDNTLLQGQPYLDASSTPNGKAIAAFNRTVAADPRVEQVLIPLRDGLTLIRRVGRG